MKKGGNWGVMRGYLRFSSEVQTGGFGQDIQTSYNPRFPRYAVFLFLERTQDPPRVARRDGAAEELRRRP